MSFIYLASPYSDPDPTVRNRRYIEAANVVAELLAHRNWVYSPIVHCHPMTMVFAMPTDFEFWRDYNFVMLDAAARLAVLKINGWEKSVGVSAEIAYAKQIKKSIVYIEPRDDGLLITDPLYATYRA